MIAGCSSGSKQSGAPLPDPTSLVKQSADATKNVKSVHLVLSIQGKISGLPIKTLTGDLTTTPATAAKGNATITLGGSDIDANFVVVDGTLYATLTPNKWSDFGKASDIYDVSVLLNPDNGWATRWRTSATPRPRAAKPSTVRAPSGSAGTSRRTR